MKFQPELVIEKHLESEQGKNSFRTGYTGVHKIAKQNRYLQNKQFRMKFKKIQKSEKKNGNNSSQGYLDLCFYMVDSTVLLAFQNETAS